MTNKPAGGVGGAEHALDLAIEAAPAAVKAAIAMLEMPGKRNAGAKLAAAKLILEVSGIGAAEADRRHAELLSLLQGEISESAYEEVVRALAKFTAQRGRRESATGEESNRH